MGASVQHLPLQGVFPMRQAAPTFQTLSHHQHMLCRELAGAGVVEALIGMLRTGNAQGQIYSAQALCNMAGDFQVRERIIAAGGPSESIC